MAENDLVPAPVGYCALARKGRQIGGLVAGVVVTSLLKEPLILLGGLSEGDGRGKLRLGGSLEVVEELNFGMLRVW